MKRIGESLILEALLDTEPPVFRIVDRYTQFVPTNENEVPYNAISLDGTSATVVTLNSTYPSTIIRG